MMLRLLLILTLLPAVSLAQEILLWKTNNSASPTIVPAYTGQTSPFPQIIEKEATSLISDTLSEEAELARMARIEALQRAEKLLSGSDALRPELGPIQIQGRVEGVAGPKVLISNQWIGVGRRLKVALSKTYEATTAIDELRKYDDEAANELESKLNQRLASTPFLDLTIVKIGDKNIDLTSTYGEHSIPIPREQ